jgi:hypothetical protein
LRKESDGARTWSFEDDDDEELKVEKLFINNHDKTKTSSKYRGVCWDSGASKWKAQIWHKSKLIHLGSFTEEEKAHEAHLKAKEQIEKGTFHPREKKSKSSKYKGVYWDSRNSTWRAQIMCKGKQIKLGSFTDEKEAREAYLKAKEQIENGSLQPPEKRRKTSKYTGVSWDSQASKWRASVKHNGKHVHVGFFIDEKEAHEAYLKAKGEQQPR